MENNERRASRLLQKPVMTLLKKHRLLKAEQMSVANHQLPNIIIIIILGLNLFALRMTLIFDGTGNGISFDICSKGCTSIKHNFCYSTNIQKKLQRV